MIQRYFHRFKEKGINSVRIKHVVNDWDSNWYVSQFKDMYMLCKGEGGTGELVIKSDISENHAKQLIDELKLVGRKSDIFTDSTTWRK